MSRIEAVIKYKEKFGDVYPSLEALGSRVHLFRERNSISGIKIDLSNFSDGDLETIIVSVGRLVDYVLMPAIEDDFSNNMDRDEWLKDKGKEINDAYDYNRLRVNKITIARGSIDLIRRTFEDNNDVRADKCNTILAQMWERFGDEDRNKISVDFADKLSTECLEVLNLLR